MADTASRNKIQSLIIEAASMALANNLPLLELQGYIIGRDAPLALQRVDELRSIARRLLRSFVGFAAAPTGGYGKEFFPKKLDEALLISAEREKLRTALGFDRS